MLKYQQTNRASIQHKHIWKAVERMFRYGRGWNPGDGAVKEWGMWQDEPDTGDNMTQVTIWHRWQYDTGDNMTQVPIWHEALKHKSIRFLNPSYVYKGFF